MRYPPNGQKRDVTHHWAKSSLRCHCLPSGERPSQRTRRDGGVSRKIRFVTVDANYELEEMITNDSRNSHRVAQVGFSHVSQRSDRLFAISSAQILFVFSNSVALPKLNLCYEINYEMKSTFLLQAALVMVP